ncbi:hypothetical protein WJX84_007245, partial [Apatococcus fuscideae]
MPHPNRTGLVEAIRSDHPNREGSTFNPLPTWRSATPWKVKSHIIVPLE